MFAFSGSEKIHLRPTRLQSSCIPTSDTEQQDFRYVSEIEPNTSPIAATIFSNFVPNHV